MALRHPDLFLSFPLWRSTRVPQKHLVLHLLHKFTALSRTTTWHAIAWWDKQHFYTGATLSSEWYFLLPARVDNWASFVLLLSCEAIFVTHSIWFSHMAMGCLVKPGAGLSSAAKEFHFAFMLLMGLFIMSLQDSVDTLLWRVKTHWVHVHLQELLKLLLSAHEM